MGGKGKEEWLPRGESGVRIVKVRRLTLQGFVFFPLRAKGDFGQRWEAAEEEGGAEGERMSGETS